MMNSETNHNDEGKTSERVTAPDAPDSAAIKTDAPRPEGGPPEGKAADGKSADSPGANGKKESTIELPMFDLEEAIRFVSGIHEKGMETAKMPDVAVACGYKHASSTPFYRRLTASRLFGLLASSGAELTLRARDYVQPTSEDAKERVLREAVTGLAYYSELLTKLLGKKLNADLIANDISRTFHLTDAGARTCAKVFESSIRFAGLLNSENTVLAPGGNVSLSKKPTSRDEPEDEVGSEDDTQRHTLFLDKQKKRKFSIVAPLAVSTAELNRICKWLEVTMILEESEITP